VDVDEYDIDTLSLGKKGEVHINALGLTVPGTVSDIARDATISGGVSFYVVKLQISAVESIRSGMSAEVRVLKEEARGALSLSISTISYDEDNNPYVFVREGEKEMVRRYLVTGVSDGVYVQILSGLKENETIYYNDGNMMRFFPAFRTR
jgi:HlyD family secretion protein